MGNNRKSQKQTKLSTRKLLKRSNGRSSLDRMTGIAPPSFRPAGKAREGLSQSAGIGTASPRTPPSHLTGSPQMMPPPPSPLREPNGFPPPPLLPQEPPAIPTTSIQPTPRPPPGLPPHIAPPLQQPPSPTTPAQSSTSRQPAPPPGPPPVGMKPQGFQLPPLPGGKPSPTPSNRPSPASVPTNLPPPPPSNAGQGESPNLYTNQIFCYVIPSCLFLCIVITFLLFSTMLTKTDLFCSTQKMMHRLLCPCEKTSANYLHFPRKIKCPLTRIHSL